MQCSEALHLRGCGREQCRPAAPDLALLLAEGEGHVLKAQVLHRGGRLELQVQSGQEGRPLRSSQRRQLEGGRRQGSHSVALQTLPLPQQAVCAVSCLPNMRVCFRELRHALQWNSAVSSGCREQEEDRGGDEARAAFALSTEELKRKKILGN